MITKDDLLCIGYIKRPHGFKGNLHITFEHEIALNKGDFVFVKREGKYIPYPIDQMGQGKHQGMLKLRFIDNHEEATELIGCELYVEADQLNEEDEISLVGFMIVDLQLGKIGKVVRVEYYPQQTMLIVNYGEQERFIPLNDSFIDHISAENKEIYCDLPQGLLDL